MNSALAVLVNGVSAGFAAYAVATLLVGFALLLLSVVTLKREKAWIRSFDARVTQRWNQFPGISIVIPAFNEEDSIVASITATLASRYPNLEVVAVNDGSKDKTLSCLLANYPLEAVPLPDQELLFTEPVRNLYVSADGRLTVVDKANGGKADALNAGINVARHPLVCVVDADTLLARDTLLKLAEPFLDNPHMLVAGGFVRLKPVANGRFAKLLGWHQQLEYARSFGLFRAGLNLLHANIIISGALGLFRRAKLIEVGGYHNMAIGEDMELVLRLHRHCCERCQPYAIAQITTAFCLTAACDNLNMLRNQRLRWQRGLLSSLFAYRDMIFSPAQRAVGMIALPFFLIFEVWGAFIEVAGLLWLTIATVTGLVSGGFLAVFLASLLFGGAVNLLVVVTDAFFLRYFRRWNEFLALAFVALTEPFAYHFLITWWRIRGSLDFWNKVATHTTWSMRGRL